MAELKPCPFCGGKVYTKFIHSRTNKMFRKLVNTYYYVKCPICGCSTEVKATAIEAETKWNTRTPQKEGESVKHIGDFVETIHGVNGILTEIRKGGYYGDVAFIATSDMRTFYCPVTDIKGWNER